jgi:hypothetical protein
MRRHLAPQIVLRLVRIRDGRFALLAEFRRRVGQRRKRGSIAPDPA